MAQTSGASPVIASAIPLKFDVKVAEFFQQMLALNYHSWFSNSSDRFFFLMALLAQKRVDFSAPGC